MRYLAIILWFCLTNICLAQTPVDFQKWQVGETKFQCRVGDPIQNYPVDTVWAAIENDFVIIGDTMTARHAYMKTDVLPDGVCKITIEHNDTTYTITQRPVRLVWLKTDTWNWIDVASTPSWGTPSVDSNVIKWTGVFPGVDYRIRKQNARVDHGIYFKPAFLDSAIVLYDQRADSLTIALANVMEYTLSANIDSADIGVGNVNKRILKKIGRHVFGMARSELHFPGSDTLQLNLVNHRWVKQGGKIYCIEYIKMRVVKMIHEVYPTATIWHNASPTTISGTTNVEDAMIRRGGWTEQNFGGADEFFLQGSADGSESADAIRCLNVASELGVGVTDITDCTLYAYCYGGTGFPVVGAYRIFKPWVEGDEDGIDNNDGDITWADWASDANEWTTIGCESADDGGSDNSGDGTGADRKATAEDTDPTALTEWSDWTMTDALAEGWYAGTIEEEGILLRWYSGSVLLMGFRSTEYSSNQPYWVFTYSTGEPPPAAGQVIIIN